MRAVIVALLLLPLTSPALRAADTPLRFEDPERQERYEALLEEVRCLVCQNQSLADSHADLAQDLRREIHTMMEEGESDAEITEFLVARYGDFVLYRPPLKETTWLLWFGPFLLLLLAAVIVIRFVRSRRPAPGEEQLDAAQRRRAAQLLEDSDEK